MGTASSAGGHWQKSTLRCVLLNTGDTDMGLTVLLQGRLQDTSVLCSPVLAQWPTPACGHLQSLYQSLPLIPVLSSFPPKDYAFITARNGAHTFPIPHTALPPVGQRLVVPAKFWVDLTVKGRVRHWACIKRKHTVHQMSSHRRMNTVPVTSQPSQEAPLAPSQGFLTVTIDLRPLPHKTEIRHPSCRNTS